MCFWCKNKRKLVQLNEFLNYPESLLCIFTKIKTEKKWYKGTAFNEFTIDPKSIPFAERTFN